MLLAQNEVEGASVLARINGRTVQLLRTLDAMHTMETVIDLLRLKSDGVKVAEYDDEDEGANVQYWARIEEENEAVSAGEGEEHDGA